jgi:hypothetical protein
LHQPSVQHSKYCTAVLVCIPLFGKSNRAIHVTRLYMNVSDSLVATHRFCTLARALKGAPTSALHEYSNIYSIHMTGAIGGASRPIFSYSRLNIRPSKYLLGTNNCVGSMGRGLHFMLVQGGADHSGDTARDSSCWHVWCHEGRTLASSTHWRCGRPWFRLSPRRVLACRQFRSNRQSSQLRPHAGTLETRATSINWPKMLTGNP